MIYTHTITSQGQITLPKRFRNRLKLTDKADISINSRGNIEITTPRKPRTIEEIRKLIAVPSGKDTYSENDMMIGEMLAKKYGIS